jgi:uncharacterized NAD(P)/FAD-binding protein YdhS
VQAGGGRIAIIGAGFSGTALAVQLLRRDGGPVALIERSGAFGPGLAYGTRSDRHLLNVPSGRMSLLPDQPDHFTRRLAREGLNADPSAFARRADYGRYIGACLAEAEAAAPGRLTRITAEVVDARLEPGGAVLRLADGRRHVAEQVVLATGNPPPGQLALAGLAAAGDRWISDPWDGDALSKVRKKDDVLLIGTGLTAVDVLLALEEQGWRGRATAVSRRGLLPRVHGARAPEGSAAFPRGPLSEQTAEIRLRAAHRPWTEVMDGLRPHGQAMWLALSPAERRRFLRHLRPWWDVHRHRMAPEIGAAMDRLSESGRLAVHAGRLLQVEPDDAGLRVAWRPRGAAEAVESRPAWVVNCTGPEGDPSRAGQPLLDALLESGAARVDGLRLGLEIDGSGRVLDAEGRPQPALWSLGPPTRGVLWEIVAVPDIRVQAASLAEQLLAPSCRRSSPIPCAHLEEVGESYREHMGVAWWFGSRLLGAGAACMIHGVAPWLFPKTASQTITRLHAEMIARRPPPR